MAEEVTTSTPSPDVSVTQQPSGTPATGNTASPGAMPETKPTLTLEEAMQRLADLENKYKNADEERNRHRKKLSTYEEAERKAQEAALSEVEKATKRASEAEAKIQHYRTQLVTAQVKMAAQVKGIIDPDLAALAVQNDLEFDDDGMPTNLEKVLDKLVKNKPYLVAAKQEVSETPAQTAPAPQVATPAIPAMNPGRSSIPSPSVNSSGKFVPVTLNDYYASRK